MGRIAGHFLLLRSHFWNAGESEPRYTLECYPAIIVLASSLLSRRTAALGCPEESSALCRRRLTRKAGFSQNRNPRIPDSRGRLFPSQFFRFNEPAPLPSLPALFRSFPR